MDYNIPQGYRKDIESVTNYLKKAGCESIFLFGSLVTGKNDENSDIDIGIKGYPKGKFFEIYSRVYFDYNTKIDLVDFDTNDSFYTMLTKIGEIVKIG